MSEWSKTKCKGPCHTDLEKVKFHFHNHNHIADPINMQAIIIKNKIIEKAKISHESTKSIIANRLERIQNGVAATLPKIDSLKGSVRRIRSKDFPRALSCIEELHIPEQFRNSLSGKAFLLFDSNK